MAGTGSPDSNGIGELAEAIRSMVQYCRFTGFTHPALLTLAEQAIVANGTTIQQATYGHPSVTSGIRPVRI